MKQNRRKQLARFGTGSDSGGLSASRLSSVRRQMVEFDDLPPEVRAALSSADQPSDRMIDVLCTMHRSGHRTTDLLKVIAASNARACGN